MYYIGTKEQCEAYNTKVTKGENYRDQTTQWAEVQQHPDGAPFAIIIHEDYESEDMQLVQRLDDTWNKELI